jgi:Holliday junction resolvase
VTRTAKVPKTLKLSNPEPSEGKIQAALIQRLRVRGWLAIRINGSGFTDSRGQFVRSYIIYGLNASAGFPDVLALKGNRFLLFEVKKRGGELTSSQERFFDYAEHFGIEPIIVEGWPEMERAIKELDESEAAGISASGG